MSETTSDPGRADADRRRDDILDAAGDVIRTTGLERASMATFAERAGISRATLYRAFSSRAEVHRAFIDRESRRLAAEIANELEEPAAPHDRLERALLLSLEKVRADPALAAWFRVNDAGVAAQLGNRSEMVVTITRALVEELGTHAPDAELASRWLVRCITSLLADPGRDAEEEVALIRRFIVPSVLVGQAR